jgi:hypothetical protein
MFDSAARMARTNVASSFIEWYNEVLIELSHINDGYHVTW